jgi:hypothetical protein
MRFLYEAAANCLPSDVHQKGGANKDDNRYEVEDI